MTNESISGFLNSIAEAKRAFDQEPVYVRQIQDLEADKKRLGDTVAHRELRIHELKQNEEALTQKLRSVEAERDDAGFRALESDEKVQTLLMVVRDFVRNGLEAISAIEGHEQIVVSKESMADIHKVNHEQARSLDGQAFRINELEAELQRLKDEMRSATEQLQRPFDPEGSATSSSAEGATDHSSPKSVGQIPDYIKEPYWGEPNVAERKGQREVDPTTALTPDSAEPQEVTSVSSAPLGLTEGQSEGPFASQAPAPTQFETASSGTASSSIDAPSSASPPERNRDRSTFFTNRKYFDVTYFVPLHKWLEDGGSYDDYYWRPADANVALPQPNRASHNS